MANESKSGREGRDGRGTGQPGEEEETELGLLCCTCDACRDGMLLIQREMLEWSMPARPDAASFDSSGVRPGYKV